MVIHIKRQILTEQGGKTKDTKNNNKFFLPALVSRTLPIQYYKGYPQLKIKMCVSFLHYFCRPKTNRTVKCRLFKESGTKVRQL